MSILTTINGLALYSTIKEALIEAKKNKLEGVRAQKLNGTLGYIGVTTEGQELMPSSELPYEEQVGKVRALQIEFPYSNETKKKKWWECGKKCGGGIGGCIGKACVGPGGITIHF